MGKLKDIVLETDILGMESCLYINKDDKKTKNLFGGIISFFAILAILSGSCYFTYQFLWRTSFTLISNSSIDHSVDFSDVTRLPFMIRISGDLNRIFPDNYWNILALTVEYDDQKGSTQKTTNYQMEKCNITKHTYGREAIFQDVQVIDSYYCMNWKDSNFTLNGYYGTKKYSYIIFFISPCINKNNSTLCGDRTAITTAFASSYIDYITLTNQIDNSNIIPNTEVITKGRIAVSNSIYKRIWLYFQKNTYTSDTGFIFESEQKTSFFNLYYISIDVDLRNVVDKSFVWVTLLNYESKTSYIRGFMKAQTLLANIGGIVNGLFLIGTIINYSISYNLYNIQLINSIFDKDSIHKEPINNIQISAQSNLLKSNLLKTNLLKKIILNNNLNNQNHNQEQNDWGNEVADKINNNSNDDKNKEDARKIVVKDDLENQGKKIVDKDKIIEIKDNNANVPSLFASQGSMLIPVNQVNKNLKKKNKLLENSEKSIIDENDDNRRLDNVNLKVNKEDKEINCSQSKLVLKSIPKQNKAINSLLNNYTKSNEKVQAARSEEIQNQSVPILNKDKLIFKRNKFEIGLLSFLDPFQWFLSKEKKNLYNDRLSKAYHHLNIFNLIRSIQKLDLLENILLQQDQVNLLDNVVNNNNVDNSDLSKSIDIILQKENKRNKDMRLLEIIGL